MNTRTTMGIALVAALSGTALAGTVSVVDHVRDTSQFMTDYIATNGAGSYAVNHLTSLPGTATSRSSYETADQNFAFGTLANAVNPNHNGNFQVTLGSNEAGEGFYYGDTDHLGNIDFSAGNDARPTDNFFAFAFGNAAWTSEDITMSFAPGVTAFGFSYEDIGDVHGELTVTFSTGETVGIAPGSGNFRDGFMSIVADTNETITSIRFNQSNDANSNYDDGFIFYDFATIQVVPVPTAALAGLGLLGGLGVVRRIKRSR